MKNITHRLNFTIAASVCGLAILLTLPATAANITKAGSGTDLTAGASWSGSVAPASSDVAVWDTGSLGAGLTLNSGTPSWLGITVNAGATDPINVGSGGTLTNGTSGINMSASTINATFGCSLSLASGYQSWSVASGKTLAINGTVSRAAGATMSFPTTGVTSTTLANDSTGILGGWATVTGTGDWAANNGSGSMITYASYTSVGANFAPSATANYKNTATAGPSASGTINSFNAQFDFPCSTFTITNASGGIILGSTERWVTGTGATLKSGLASGELFIHANTATFANGFQIQPSIVNNAAVAVTAVIKDGSGQCEMGNGASTFSGGFYLNAGSVYVGANSTGTGAGVTSGPLGTGTVTLNAGSLFVFGKGNGGTTSTGYTIGNNVVVPSGSSPTINNGGLTGALNGNVSGGGSLTFAGTGVTGFLGTNSYGGGTTISAGTLGVGNVPGTNVNLSTGAVAVSGGTLRVGYAVTSNQNNTYTTNSITLAGTIYEDDAFQHLAGPINVTGASTLGSTYNGGGTDADKGLYVDGLVSGSAALTVQHTRIGTGQNYDTAYVVFTNNANTYSGTITINENTATTEGGVYLGVNGSLALSNVTVITAAIPGATLRFGTSPIVFKTGLGSATLGAISGSGPLVLAGYDAVNHTYTGGGTIALTVGGNNSTATYSGVISGASGSLTKAGSGTLTLSGANTYTGATTVSGGTLFVNNTTGSATGAGNVTFNGGTTLAGTGIITNGVILNSGTILSPGSNNVGTLTVGLLTLNSGVTNNFEFNTTPTNDQVVVTVSGGLAINGGVFNLYQAGTTLPLLTPGTYNLIQYTGSIGGTGLDSTWTTASATNPHILNNRPGFTYQFGTSGGWVTLTIVGTANIGTWTANSDGIWSLAGNWTGTGTMPPSAANDTANFGVSTAFRTVNLNANETVGVINMTNANSFAITNAANTLTLDESGYGAVITVTAGTSNSIQSAVALNDNLAAVVSSGKSLAISGNLSNTSGAKTVTANGAGTLALSGNNTYGPAAGTVGTILSAGILQVGGNSALGAGDLSVTASSTLQAGGSATLSNNVTLGSGATATVDANSASLTLGGVISGSGAISKSTAGTVTLTGANTYSGASTISGGTVIAGSATALGTTAGGVTLSGGSTLDMQTDGGDNAYNISIGSGNTVAVNSDVKTGSVGINHTLGALALGNSTLNLTKGPNVASGSPAITFGAVNLSAGVAGTAIINPTNVGVTLASASIALNNSAKTLQLDGTSTNNSVTGVIANGLNTVSLTKANTGTWTLSGANTYTGQTTVSGGTLALTGSGTISSTVSPFLIGTVAGTPAAVYQSGASTFATAQPTGGAWNLGNVAGASGYYNLSAGTLTIQNNGELDPAGNTGGAGTFGQFDMGGGTVNVGTSGTGATYFLPCRSQTGGESSVVNLSGGTFTILNGMTDGQYGGYEANWNAGGDTNVTTISGSALFQSLTESVKLNWMNNAGNVGILNLNGGTWQMLGLNNSYDLNVRVNFNGGTVKAGNSANGTFLGNSAAAYVYGGGATVDNNGQAITISQPLLAPAGNGVATIPVSAGGAGYVMPPQVQITGGGGSNATAYAQISGGAVTGIVVTSPGQNYASAPTVTLVGGGSTSAATLGTVTTAPNTSGGLTAIGSSTLTLSGASTYTGSTVVSNSSLVMVSGSLAAVNKEGNGTLTLNNNNPAVTTATIVGAGSLVLGAGGSLSNTPSITVSNGAIFDVSAVTGGFTLLGSQSLYGSGTNKGPVNTVSGAKIYADAGAGYGTNTFIGNLTLVPGANVYFNNLTTNYNGTNDFISISGNLTNTGTVYVSAPSTSVNLDTNQDYVLMTAAGGFNGSVSPTPLWGTKPLNWANYTVVTNGNNVQLHWTASSAAVIVSATAAPATLTRNESTLITVTVVNGTGSITNAYLDASTVGLSGSVPLYSYNIGGQTNVYTNSIVIPPTTAVGSYSMTAYFIDSTPLTASIAVPLTVVATNQVWNGAGPDAFTDDNTNWISGSAPGYLGDGMTFAGSVNTSVNVDQNYTVTGLLFSNNAASFTIGGNALTLSGSGPIANYSTNAQTLNAVVQDAGGGLTASGVGPIVLAAAESYTGPTIVSSGTLNVSSAASVTSSGTTTVGNTATNAVLISSGTLTQTKINVGTVSGAVGAIYQTGGTVTPSAAAGPTDFQIGNAAGAYGYYYVGSAGSLYPNEIGVAGESGAGNGLMDIYGTVNDGGWFVMSRTASAQTGVLNVFSSGSLSYIGNGIWNCWGGGQTAIINILGGSVNNSAYSTSGINLNESGNASNTGILNLLNGGTAQGNYVEGPYGQVNFNGGTLQAYNASTSFMTGLGSVNIYSGGATINDNGTTITVNQPLLAPTGSGVTTPTITSGGTGYVAPPIVTVVTNVLDTTGSGATAIAQIDTSTGNATSGQVTNVLITCPGVNYMATPTFVLSGGGASTPAVITGNANTANVSGGLTKTGGGTLTLGGYSTYTGNTVVNAGTLKLEAPVLHLTFDNVSGTTVINQGSGGAVMNGILTGTATVVSGGRFGKALSIPSGAATAAYVLVTNSVNPLNITSPSNSWTLGMWLKTSTAGGVYAYQGSGGWVQNNTEFYLAITNGADGAGTHAGGVRSYQGWEAGTNIINDGNWHFVVMTCNSGMKAQYVDGTLDSLAVNQWSAAGAGTEVCIGGTPSSSADSQIGLNGLIDEVYIYNRALSQTEIQQLYNNNSSQVLPTNTIVNTASGTLDVAGLSQQVGGLTTGSGNVLLDDSLGFPGTLTVNNAGSDSYGNVISDTSGAGSLVKIGGGMLTLSSANTYGGSTTVSNGTLVVSGSLAAGPVTVATAGILGGLGTVGGAVTVNGNLSPSGETAFGSPGTLTLSSNLTIGASGICSFALGSSYSSGNDQVAVTGHLTNNNALLTAIHINALGTLDQTGDYVLISAAGGVAGNYSTIPIWDGTTPVNAANFTIVTNATQVTLHYSSMTPPTASIMASPTTVSRNESVLVTLNETNGSAGVSNVTLNASSIGAGSVTMAFSSGNGGTNVYTATIAAAANIGAGSYGPMLATVTDSNGLTATVGFSLTVTTTNDVWGGAGVDNNFSTSLNWTNDAAPGYVGDSLDFAGTLRTNGPNMETNYSVTGVTFDSTAGGFTIGTANSSALTVTAAGVVNNSTNAQTLNVPVTLGAAQTLNAANGPLTLGQSLANGGYLVTVTGSSNSVVNSISGAGGLTKNGSGMLTLSGTSTYNGNTTIGAGMLNLSGSQTGASGQMIVGSTAANVVLQVSGSLTSSNLMVGNASGAVGAVYQTGGSVSDTIATAYDNSCIGNILGAFGYYYAGGGTYTSDGLAVGGEGTVANVTVPGGVTGGNGIMDINGGIVNDTGWLVMSRGASNETGILNVFSGTLTYAGGGIVANWGSNQTAVVTIMGGVVSNTAAGVGFNLNHSGNVTNMGILNLNGGVARGTNVTGSYGQVNFNGGTLQASAANGSFMTGLGSALIYSNGATIDNGGFAITIAQPLLAPTNYGVSSISLSSGGTGYIAPPIVTLSGGVGSGATAIAQINPVTGVVTNLLVTSAGNNYLVSDTLTVSFAGGGGSGAAANTPALTANIGGGLTANGTGLLTLTGTNTYAGPTVINGGTIQIGNELQLGAVPASPATNITLNGGGLYNNYSAPVLSANRTIYLGASGGYLQAGYLAQSGSITVNGQITGPGGLNINWDGSPVYLNALNTYQGNTTIGTAFGTYYNNVAANPTLALGIDNALPYGGTAGFVAFGTSANNNTATLNLNGHNATINGLSASGTNAIVDNTVAGTTNVLTVGWSSGYYTFAGVIRNTGGVLGLTKTGVNTLALTGTNTYTGNTTVNAGTLIIANATLNTNSTVEVDSGATLNLTFSVTNNVAYLVLGGVSQVSGVYSNGNSYGLITGAGSLQVTAGASGTSTDASLSNLVVNASVPPTFIPGTTNYYATNYNGVGTVTVLVTNNSAFATNMLYLNGVSYGQLTNEVTSVALPVGVGNTNYIQVQVTAQDGLTTSNYFVTVTRLASTNALLSNLVITAAGTLYPTFNSATNSYNATNTYVNKTVTVTATSADGTAALALSFNNGSSYSIPLTTTVASGSQTLVLPTNTVAVRAVSQDLSQTNIYTVNVLLQPSLTVPHLTNSVSGSTLALSWPADHLGYRLLVQTNNLNKGVSGNTNDWGTVANSTSILSTNIAIIKTGVTNEYYKLVYP